MDIRNLEDGPTPFDTADDADQAKEARQGSVRTHHVRVTLAGGEVLEVTTRNPDLIRFDLTRTKRNWPGADEAPMLWLTFITWSAMKREHLTDATWEVFSDSLCLDLEMIDATDVDPTKTVPGAV